MQGVGLCSQYAPSFDRQVWMFPVEYLSYGTGDVATIVTRPTGSKEYKIVDHLGSVRTAFDSQGNILQQSDFEPFGKVLETGTIVTISSDRRSWIGKETDNESELGDFGVRKYDEDLGRFLSCDPLWEKYRVQNPYQYALNSPLIAFDKGGDSVSIITSAPAANNTDGESGVGGLAGHSALNIDGTVYSFEGDGKWKVYSYNSYIENEHKTRSIIEQTIKVDQSKVQQSLGSRVNGAYDVEKNSCVTNVISVLKSGGIPFNNPNGAVSPEKLVKTLQESRYVTNAKGTLSVSKSSIMGGLFYQLFKYLKKEGVVLKGVKENTNQLLPTKSEK